MRTLYPRQIHNNRMAICGQSISSGKRLVNKLIAEGVPVLVIMHAQLKYLRASRFNKNVSMICRYRSHIRANHLN